MMQIAVSVGRLAEVRFASPFGADDLSKFMADIRAVVERAEQPLVFFTDWREVDAFSPSEYDTIVWIMRRDNPRIETNAVLLDPANVAFVEQARKLLVEAANRKRAAFTDPAEVRAFLGKMLAPAERRQLDTLLAEPRKARVAPKRAAPASSRDGTR